MPSYMIRGLPEGLVSRAKAKAREAGAKLDDVLVRFLESYAQHGSIQSSGGHARKLAMTDEERAESARKAAEARWKGHQRDGGGD
jgi:hypothetical protein